MKHLDYFTVFLFFFFFSYIKHMIIYVLVIKNCYNIFYPFIYFLAWFLFSNIKVFTIKRSKPRLIEKTPSQKDLFIIRLDFNLKYNDNVFVSFCKSSLLGEGTTNIWWILLHNDRKNRHRRIKKQHRYERLRCNTSRLCL